MNVLLVTTSYPLRKEAVSGIFVKKLVDQLREYTNVTVVTPADDQDFIEKNIKCARYAPQKLQILSHRPGGIPVALKSKPYTWLLLPSLVLSMLFQCVVQSRNKDVVIANWSINGVIAGVAAKLFNIPLITILRGSDVSMDDGKRKPNWVLLFAIKLSTKVVCVSDNFYNEMVLNYSKYHDKFIMIPNGVDGEFLDLKKTIDKSTVVLTTVGNLNPKKGIQVIIDACKLLHDKGIRVELNVIGDGPDKSRLIGMVNTLGLSKNVNFVGIVPHQEIGKYLARSTIFVFASFSEGRANVLLEAMASGLPIVASAIDANKELIKDDVNGCLFNVGDSFDLAAKIEALVESEQIRERIAKAARKTIVVDGLSWSATGAKYQELMLSSLR